MHLAHFLRDERFPHCSLGEQCNKPSVIGVDFGRPVGTKRYLLLAD
jgi:hypothetical protein